MSDDNLSFLNPDEHWLGWLGDDPRSAVRSQLEALFQRQTPGAKLEQLVITSQPKYLTGAKPTADPDQVEVVRAALAAPFYSLVREASGALHEVEGVFSWAAVGLNETNGRLDRMWLDLFDDADQAFDLLDERVYLAGVPD